MSIDKYTLSKKLLQVAKQGNLSEFRALVTSGCDISQNADDALVQAVMGDSLEIVRYIVEELNISVNKHGGRAFSLCSDNHPARRPIFDYFIQQGVDPNISGGFPLYNAAVLKNTYSVKTLLERGANFSVGAMEEAIKRNQIDIVKLMLRSHPHEYSSAKWASYAAACDNIEIMDLLLHKVDFYSLNTVLRAAIQNNRLEAAKYFFEKGIFPDSDIKMSEQIKEMAQLYMARSELKESAKLVIDDNDRKSDLSEGPSL